MSGASALFNSACEGPHCLPGTEIDFGSVAIDYESDPANPIFHRLVLHGGRGWSIFEIPEDPSALLRLVYDSADTVEKLGCERFPWAHNSAQNEEFAPINMANNTFYQVADEETREAIEDMNDPERDGCADQGDGTPGACPLSELQDTESHKRGVEINLATIGFACGRLVTAVVGEGNSISVLYDITEITSPSVIDIIHLSPSSETKSPGLAFNDGTIGEIDTVNIIFLSASESPSGKPALMYFGQASGTVSMWEIECEEPDDPKQDSPAKVQNSGAWSRRVWGHGLLVLSAILAF